ncbi:MAG: hypothetical protein ACLRIQ_26160, partial [Blautia wexlerae]
FSITVITRIPGVRGWKIPALFLHNLILRKYHIIMCWSTLNLVPVLLTNNPNLLKKGKLSL